jgi:hypothetical protein
LQRSDRGQTIESNGGGGVNGIDSGGRNENGHATGNGNAVSTFEAPRVPVIFVLGK